MPRISFLSKGVVLVKTAAAGVLIGTGGNAWPDPQVGDL
jgi:hypothetical protein